MAYIASANSIEKDSRPLMAAMPLGASDDDPLIVWISNIIYTGQTETRDGVVYKKCKLYTSYNFDVTTSPYKNLYYNYKAQIVAEWKKAITENSTVEWSYTGGTTVDNSGIPTYAGYEAKVTISSDVLVPSEECASSCFFQAMASTSEGEPFDRTLFIYSRKGDLKASDKVVTGYGVVESSNTVSSTFGQSYANLSSATVYSTTSGTSVAAVEAKVAKKASITASSEDGVYTLTQPS